MLPGRLTTTAPPSVTPASPRDSTAVAGPPERRIASARPGSSSSISGRVASGVRSRGETPVPPLVSTTRAPASSAAEIASPTLVTPSGTTAGSGVS